MKIIIAFNCTPFDNDMDLLEGCIYAVQQIDEAIIYEVIDSMTDDVYEDQTEMDLETDRLVTLAQDNYAALFYALNKVLNDLVPEDYVLTDIHSLGTDTILTFKSDDYGYPRD